MELTREQRDWRLKDLVEAAEAAEILGGDKPLTTQAVRLMAAKGRLNGVKIGTAWVFLRAEVKRMVDTERLVRRDRQNQIADEMAEGIKELAAKLNGA